MSIPPVLPGDIAQQDEDVRSPDFNRCLGEAVQNYSELKSTLCVLCWLIQAMPYSGQ